MKQLNRYVAINTYYTYVYLQNEVLLIVIFVLLYVLYSIGHTDVSVYAYKYVCVCVCMYVCVSMCMIVKLESKALIAI